MKNADPLAPMAIGRHSDSPTTNASAMSPVAYPMSATPSSHVAVFSHEFWVWCCDLTWFGAPCRVLLRVQDVNREDITWVGWWSEPLITLI